MTQAQLEKAAYKLISYEALVIRQLEEIAGLTTSDAKALQGLDEGVKLGFQCKWPVFATANYILKKPEIQLGPTTTREQRRQIRLDKAARRYAKAVKRGRKTVRYY